MKLRCPTCGAKDSPGPTPYSASLTAINSWGIVWLLNYCIVARPLYEELLIALRWLTFAFAIVDTFFAILAILVWVLGLALGADKKVSQ
jgi:hypothetical protein